MMTTHRPEVTQVLMAASGCQGDSNEKLTLVSTSLMESWYLSDPSRNGCSGSSVGQGADVAVCGDHTSPPMNGYTMITIVAWSSFGQQVQRFYGWLQDKYVCVMHQWSKLCFIVHSAASFLQLEQPLQSKIRNLLFCSIFAGGKTFVFLTMMRRPEQNDISASSTNKGMVLPHHR